MKTRWMIMVCGALLALVGVTSAQDTTYKPFVLASISEGDLEQRTAEVTDQLLAAGFRLAGQYAPLPDTRILVVTDDELLAAAASERGGYAAAQRIGITETGGQIEVSFVNPQYIEQAYRLDSDLGAVRARLTGALGFERACGGGNKKMTARKLRKYNYMMGMQKFDDPSELGRYASHTAAVAAVETGLAREGDGLAKVYRIDIPDSEQTLFGVSMTAPANSDEKIDEAAQMAVVDFEGCRKRAYFPYEVLVNGNEVEALHMRFRMAVHFPNLSMMGKHGFTKLMAYPGDIEDALQEMLAGTDP